ncbi:MAG: gliding motility-associated C-terminal domain-containing protein [Bacteroidia bacterium]
MKKFTLLFSFFAAFAFSSSLQIFAQQAAPGVPGACGYGNKNAAVRTNTPSSPQDGTGTLGNIYNVSKCGLNYIAVSQRLGQRFTPAGTPQPAPFTVSGLQTCDSIEKAFLWVEGSGTGAPQTATIQPPVGPAQNFPMILAGTGPDKCWGYAGSATYRADVTSAITGNGTYNISGLFTSTTNPGEDMDGATLVIIYSDHLATYQGTLIIDDGAIVIGGGIANYNMNYPAVCGATTNASAFCCVGDIQFPVNSLTMNNTPAPFNWDWWNFVSTPTTVTAAQTTSNFNLNSSGDCFNLCVVGMYYQTTSCSVCPLVNPIANIATVSTPSTCPGCTGTATASPFPAGSYTYSWNPSGQTTSTATNLCAGIYTVTVTGGCMTQTATITVGNTGNLTAAPSQNNVTCFQGANGSATVTPAGGTGPYSYSWAPSGGNAATASALVAGSYTATTTDAAGCVYLSVFSITEPPGMTITPAITNVACNGQTNGSSTLTVTGGTPGYSYSWTSGGTTATETGLGPGSYSYTVTDNNGCAQTQSITITQPAPLTSTMTTIDIGCAASGSATILVNGGTGQYTYLWSSGGNSATDINLTVGTYTVLVTDSNGCTLVDTAIINNSSGITNTSSSTNVSCFGLTDGSATIVPVGGNLPYSYSWTPSVGNTATVNNLTGGSYTVTATDANGCVTSATFSITQPTALTTVSAATSVSCNGGSNGTGTVSPNGGTGPYSYVWTPAGGTSQTANGLSAGSYSVNVTDSHGCTSIQVITITQPSALAASVSGDSVCSGQSALITANANGGIAPYTYLWSAGPNPTAATQTVVSPVTTTYTVTITDANGCTSASTTTVQVNALPSAAFTTNAVNGVITLNGAGSQACFYGPAGASGWFWDLNGVATSTLQSPCVPLSPADAGAYCASLTVVDNLGCTSTDSVCLEINDVYYSVPNVFTPDNDGVNDGFVITNLGMRTLHCDIYNRWGELMYQWDGTTGYWNGQTKNGNDAVDGVYYYTAYMSDFRDKTYEINGFVQLIRGK